MKIEEIADKIKKSFSSLNLTSKINSNDNFYILYFISDSKIYHLKDDTEDKTNSDNIIFVKSRGDSFNMFNISDLNLQIKEDLKKCDVIYYFDDVYILRDQIIIAFEKNLVEEIILFCNDILLELSDIGFKTHITVTSDTNSNGKRSHSKPPKGIYVYIERHDKFKYLKNEKEKLILYKNRIGNDYEEVELKEYIDWLEDYLKEFGFKFTKDVYDYNNKEIKLCFNR